MSEDIVSQLMEHLSNRCFLHCLGLVHVGLSELNWPLLCKLVEDSQYLEELDISWCQVRPFFVHDLTEILAKNKRLKRLNLSHMQLFEGAVRLTKIVKRSPLANPELTQDDMMDELL